MDGSTVESEKIEMESDAEPLLGILDIILLAALIIGAGWWFMRNKRQKEEITAARSYSIQCVLC